MLDDGSSSRGRSARSSRSSCRRTSSDSIPRRSRSATTDITGWYEGPADRIFEVRLASGRRVRVTAGHNLFTLDRDGALTKVRTGELRPGVRGRDPATASRIRRRRRPRSTCSALIPEPSYPELVCAGQRRDTFAAIAARRSEASAPMGSGTSTTTGRVDACRSTSHASSAFCPDLRCQATGSTSKGRREFDAAVPRRPELRLAARASTSPKGRADAISSRSRTPIRRSSIASRPCSHRLGLPVYAEPARSPAARRSSSSVLGWLGTGDGAPDKRVPPIVFGWPNALIECFFEGLVDGDGSRRIDSDVGVDHVGCTRRRPASSSCAASGCAPARRGATRHAPICQVVLSPTNEHKLLTRCRCPTGCSSSCVSALGLDQRTAADEAGYQHPTDLRQHRTPERARRRPLRDAAATASSVRAGVGDRRSSSGCSAR